MTDQVYGVFQAVPAFTGHPRSFSGLIAPRETSHCLTDAFLARSEWHHFAGVCRADLMKEGGPPGIIENGVAYVGLA